ANIITQHMGAFAALSGEPVTQNDNSIFSDNSDEDGSILDKQVEDLNLSVRSYNCLKRAGIHTVRQLLDFSEDDLLNIRNFGTKSIDEVKEKLEEMDMGLKNS
ncbi:MAG: DNA-directed RNA polymerase subunit alpha, partial [Coriobacteriales bacterium]|nr:DNA-directed RNA polymerase subunit alpha [Coriobacteriales bacterium]